MNLPFIKYIEALIVTKKPVDEIYEKITKLVHLPLTDKVPKEGLQEIYAKIYEHDPEYFKKPGVLASDQLLEKLDVQKMYKYLMSLPGDITGVPGAFEIINDADMYRVISALALARIDNSDIELIFNAKYNIHFDMDDIKEFLKYFFDVSNWSLSDKKLYVENVINPGLRNAYNYALEGDKDYLMWKLGIAPEKSYESMLKDLSMDAFFRSKEAANTSPDDARKYTDLFLKILDRSDKLESDKNKKHSYFEAVRITLSGQMKLDDPDIEKRGKNIDEHKHIKDLGIS